MRIVAFKYANHPKSLVKNSLPENFITEWIYQDLSQVELNEQDGWNFLPEEDFNIIKQNQENAM